MSIARGSYHGAANHTQAFLVMTHDDGNGKMHLENDRLNITWKGVGKQPIFAEVDKKLREATKAVGGTYVVNPGWTKLMNYDLTTVHPLGGCIMGEDAQKGAVNHKGEVFASGTGTDVHKGLYVCDGAVIPLPLGVNPLITISALAERCCELMAQDYGFQINYDYKDLVLPETEVKPGIQFTETMKGFFSTDEKLSFENGEKLGKESGSLFEFTLTVVSEDVETMLKGKDHCAKLEGVVKAPALSSKPLTITDGIFNLFVDEETGVPAKLMKYRMVMHTEECKSFYFYGYKMVRDDKGFDMWKDTCTLFITIHETEDETSPVLGKGIIVIKTADFIKQMTTMKVLHAKSEMEKLKVMTQFGKYFSGSLYEIYLKPHMPSLNMTRHGALSIITNIKPGMQQQVIDWCKEIEEYGVDNNPIIPFSKITSIHFARFVVLNETTNDFGEHEAARLVFTTNYDLPLDNHLRELVSIAGKGLWQLFAACEGFPDNAYNEAKLIDYLKSVMIKTATFYVGVGNCSVQQIKEENNLREQIEFYLDKQKGELKNKDASFVRQKVIDFINSTPALSWATQPAAKPSLAWKISFYGKFVLFVFLTIVLLPIIIPFVIIWMLLVFPAEIKEKDQYCKVSKDYIRELVDRETGVVQTQFSAVGDVKLAVGLITMIFL
jgi:hypothetical protein